MKRMTVIAVALVVILTGSAFAAGTAHQNTGCGLGTLMFKNSADNSSMLQAFQICLNNFPPLSAVPTFGISFGTADCQKPTQFASNERANEFMVANMDNLARDIAQGHGETLDAFAELIEVPAEQRPEFYQQLQSGFDRIFTSSNVQMASVMDNIATVSAR